MAGSRFLISVLTAVLVFSDTATRAQENEDRPEPPPHRGGEGPRDRERSFRKRPEFEKASNEIRQILDQMPPEQRREFLRNFSRIMQIPPEDRDPFTERNEGRRKKLREELEQAMKEAGIAPANEEERKAFFKRYIRERKAIEEQLKKEMEERRQPLLKELMERLKAAETGSTVSESKSEAPGQTESAPVK